MPTERLRFPQTYLLICIWFLFTSCEEEQNFTISDDKIFQISTITALLEGDYRGLISFADLETKGNFGLGTFEAVDGEMVMLDGVFYQIRVDGAVRVVDPKIRSPFVTLKHFASDMSVELQSISDLSSLGEELDNYIDGENNFYAIKVEATFDSLVIRSVPKQSEPFPPLSEVVGEQVTFNYQNIEGTLVGFRFPSYASDINVGGYHFHFVSRDLTAGGHVLECRLTQGMAQIDRASDLVLKLGE